MITFFLLLAVLMVLVVAAGSMMGGSRRRVIYERSPIMRSRPVIEEYVDEPILEPVARTRRVVRRRSY
jgi:hypothetical protein